MELPSFTIHIYTCCFACTQSNYPDHCLYFQWSAVTKKRRTFPKNFMLLALGILLFLYPIIGNTYLDTFSDQPLMLYFYYLGTLIIFYLFIMTIAYTISSFLNLFHWKKQDIDYVVVLGSGLIGDKVPPLLASRINKGIQIYKSNQNCKLIFLAGKVQMKESPKVKLWPSTLRNKVSLPMISLSKTRLEIHEKISFFQRTDDKWQPICYYQ